MEVRGDGICCEAQSFIKNAEAYSVNWIFRTIDFSFVDRLAEKKYSEKGRRGYPPSLLYKCLLLAYLMKLSIRRMVLKLECIENNKLRVAIGFEAYGYQIPHRTTFSKFIQRLGKRTFILIFLYLVRELVKHGVIGGICLVADATLFKAYSNPRKKKIIDPDAQWGFHKKQDNRVIFVFGYKLHLIIDMITGLPINLHVTSANMDEGRILPALISAVMAVISKVYFVLADSAYDYNRNRHAVAGLLNAISVFALNPRNTKGNTEKEKKKKRAENLKKWYWKAGLLDYYLDPLSKMFKELYKDRMPKENTFNILDEELGLGKLRFRGLEKATIHACLCCTCMLVVALTAHHTGREDLLLSPKSFTA
jgi:transposase